MPNALYTMYRMPTRAQRTTHTLRPIYEPKTKNLKASLFFKYTIIYNQLPNTFKELPKVKFKRQIKIYIRDNKQYHIIPDTSTDDSDESEWSLAMPLETVNQAHSYSGLNKPY